MRIFRTKRAAVLGVIASLAIAAAAIAYWTSSGSGTGTGEVGTNAAGEISLDGAAIAIPTLDAADTSVVTATNNGDSPVRVTNVSVDRVTADADHAGCNSVDHPTWFTLSKDVAQNVTVENGDTVALPNTVSVRLNNIAGENQDVCRNAQLTVHLSSTSV